MINTNLLPNLHRFRDMADYWSHFRYNCSDRRSLIHFNGLAGGDPCEYPDKLITSSETRMDVLLDI